MSFAESSRGRFIIKSNCASKEYIGKMPDNVISNILNRLPLKEAVRTSALARNWRYKWCLLTDVILDDDLFYFLTTKFDGKDITKLLQRLRGPIRRFVFSTEPKTVCGLLDLKYEEIRDWLSFLSAEGIEEMKIRNWYGEQVTLPSDIYSRTELKHLELHHCKLPSLDTLVVFPNLLTVELLHVRFVTGTFWEFIVRCPSVEFLKVDYDTTKQMRLMELTKVRHIKKLHLSFGMTYKPTTITASNLYHLASLTKLENLTLDFQDCNLLVEANPNKNVPVNFVSLMTLNVSGVDFGNNVMVSFVIRMILASPKLQTLETRASNVLSDVTCELSAFDLDSNTFGARQLQSVVFHSFPRSFNELNIIKFLLAYSPSLKKLCIRLSQLSVNASENLKNNWELARKLLELERAAKTAVVVFF